MDPRYALEPELEWALVFNIAQVYSQSPKTPTPSEVCLALLQTCTEVTQRDEAVEAVRLIFDKQSCDPKQLASWMDVACEMCRWLSETDDAYLIPRLGELITDFADWGVLHRDMVNPLVQFVIQSRGFKPLGVIEALIKLAEQGFTHGDMSAVAVSLATSSNKRFHAAASRLLYALPGDLKRPAAMEVANAIAEKYVPGVHLSSSGVLATIIGMLLAMGVRIFEKHVLEAISSVADGCAAARDVCAELISVGAATPAFLHNLQSRNAGRSILSKCAGDLRIGSGVLLAPLKECFPTSFCIALAVPLMINEHRHCRVLRNVHKALMLPSEVWVTVVDCIGLFNSAFVHLAVVDASELPGCSLQTCLGTKDFGSNCAHAEALEQGPAADPFIGAHQVVDEESILILPEEAAAVVEEQWASAVELRIAKDTSESSRDGTVTSSCDRLPFKSPRTDSHLQAEMHSNEQSSTCVGPVPLLETVAEPEAIYILQYNKHPRSFMDALLNGRALQECRQALEHEGHSCQLPSGCKVFVHPHQFRLVMDELNGKDLRAHHVVVAESIQHLVEESLAQLSYKQRPRVKVCSRLEASSAASSEDIVDEMTGEPQIFDENFDVGRSLLCYLPLRRAESVVQSAPVGNSMNPRRAAHPDRIDDIVPDS